MPYKTQSTERIFEAFNGYNKIAQRDLQHPQTTKLDRGSNSPSYHDSVTSWNNFSCAPPNLALNTEPATRPTACAASGGEPHCLGQLQWQCKTQTAVRSLQRIVSREGYDFTKTTRNRDHSANSSLLLISQTISMSSNSNHCLNSR